MDKPSLMKIRQTLETIKANIALVTNQVMLVEKLVDSIEVDAIPGIVKVDDDFRRLAGLTPAPPPKIIKPEDSLRLAGLLPPLSSEEEERKRRLKEWRAWTASKSEIEEWEKENQEFLKTLNHQEYLDVFKSETESV